MLYALGFRVLGFQGLGQGENLVCTEGRNMQDPVFIQRNARWAIDSCQRHPKGKFHIINASEKTP
jgi:hypothetical protein